MEFKINLSVNFIFKKKYISFKMNELFLIPLIVLFLALF